MKSGDTDVRCLINYLTGIDINFNFGPTKHRHIPTVSQMFLKISLLLKFKLHWVTVKLPHLLKSLRNLTKQVYKYKDK